MDDVIIEIELNFIGALFDKRNQTDDIFSLEPHDFIDKDCGFLYRAIRKYYYLKEPFDEFILGETYQGDSSLSKELQNESLSMHLSELHSNSPGNAKQYATLIKNRAIERRLSDTVAHYQDQLKNGSDPLKLSLELVSTIEHLHAKEHPKKSIVESFSQLIAEEIKPREMVIDPWLPVGGLAMVYAERGIGKTFFAMNLGYAVMAGHPFFKWSVPMPRSVLYLDGEMHRDDLKSRLQKMHNGQKLLPLKDYNFLSKDSNKELNFNLNTQEGQYIISQHIKGIDLIIVDNIAALCGGEKDNEVQSWHEVQKWAISMRHHNIAVIFIHHMGKNKEQRGTSAREDVLDTSLKLIRPNNYKMQDGLVMEVHFTKTRGFFGEASEPFQVSLNNEQSLFTWSMDSIKDEEKEKPGRATVQDTDIAYMYNVKGMTQVQIAQELNLSQSIVSRVINRIDRNQSD